MGMGIVSDSAFDAELKLNSRAQINSIQSSDSVPSNQSSDSVPSNIPLASVSEIKRGRGDSLNVPSEIRALAALSAVNGEGSGADIARAFGISESSVSAYKQGAHSTASYDSPNPALLDKINDHKLKVTSKARNRLLAALDEITPNKLTNVKPRDLAAIAKDMCSIVTDMEPKVSTIASSNSVQIVFMAPRVKDINEYKVMDVVD